MGINNSSEHRVKPLMKSIENNDENFKRFIALITDKDLKKPDSLKFYYADKKESKKEKGLLPTKKQLISLVEYLYKNGQGLKSDIENRQKIFNGDENTKDLAINIIEHNYPKKCSKAWYIFEGRTYPDFYIEGDDYIIVGEGKWTEPHLTNETSYLHIDEKGYGRNQMIRHIQGAINCNKQNKKIIAFYIVDKEIAIKNNYYVALDSKNIEESRMREQLDKEILKIDDAEKEKIIESYYGMITWQDVEEALNLKFRLLKDAPK